MKEKIGIIVMFTCSAIALIISLKLFLNMAIFVDEYNTSLDIICGGDLWLYMDWLRLVLLTIVAVYLGIKIFRK